MSSTLLVHIGDFHAAPGPRNADRYRALDQIISEASRLPNLGAWLWPGDLFDALSSTPDRNALDERLQRMAAVAPVLICYGNHDKPGDLDGFARLQSAWPISVVDRPCCVRIRLAGGRGGNATVFVLPYPQKAGLAGAGVAAGDVVATAGDLLEPIFMHAAAELETARQAGDYTLMIGHVNVAGAIASTGQPNIGREIELTLKHLDRLGTIPKLLNHIHKPQEIAGAWYAGSVCRMDYGEREEKRYLVVELTAPSPTLGLTSFEVFSKPIDIAPMFHIEGTLTRDGFRLAEGSDAEIERRYHAIDWVGADLRVRYTYKSSERAALNSKLLDDIFAGALRLKVESIVEQDRDVRAPEVAAAKTLAAKLAAYQKVQELPPTIAEKLDRLEVLDHEGAQMLLAHVARTLKAIEFPAAAAAKSEVAA